MAPLSGSSGLLGIYNGLLNPLQRVGLEPVRVCDYLFPRPVEILEHVIGRMHKTPPDELLGVEADFQLHQIPLRATIRFHCRGSWKRLDAVSATLQTFQVRPLSKADLAQPFHQVKLGVFSSKHVSHDQKPDHQVGRTPHFESPVSSTGLLEGSLNAAGQAMPQPAAGHRERLIL